MQLEHALEYHNQGHHVIPTGKNKKPLVEWKIYQTEKPMLDEVQEWWAKWPDANIGLVTGKVTNLVVIDVDNADGIKTMQEMGNGLKPYTRSPNGYHFWFDFHEGLSNKAALMPGIDVRTDG